MKLNKSLLNLKSFKHLTNTKNPRSLDKSSNFLNQSQVRKYNQASQQIANKSHENLTKSSMKISPSNLITKRRWDDLNLEKEKEKNKEQ